MLPYWCIVCDARCRSSESSRRGVARTVPSRCNGTRLGAAGPTSYVGVRLYCNVFCGVVPGVVLCRVVLYCIALYCISLYCIVLYCIVLYCIVLHCIVLYCIVLYCIVLYCIVLYCIVLYCIVLYCIVLYCIGPSGTTFFGRFQQRNNDHCSCIAHFMETFACSLG